MKLIVKIVESTVKRARDLVNQGTYSSLSEFFQTAADNQLELEADSEEVLQVSEHVFQASEQVPLYERPLLRVAEGRSPTTGAPSKRKRQTPDPSPPWHLLKMLPDRTSLTPMEPGECASVFNARGILWGQINRLLPWIVGLRVLGHMVESDGNAVDLETFRTKAAAAAASLGAYLQKLDAAAGRKRDEAYSAAFPSDRRGRGDLEKSLNRYKNHFLANLRTDGRAGGALAQLELVGVKTLDKGGAVIGLTEAGIQFQGRLNPILDDTEDEGSLSQDEKDLYLTHVIKTLPDEAEAMALLLLFIHGGIFKRTELNQKLAGIWQKDWSAAVVNTQRSGLTGRMVELGLLGKKKHGVTVEYLVTEQGLDFFTRVDKSQAEDFKQKEAK